MRFGHRLVSLLAWLLTSCTTNNCYLESAVLDSLRAFIGSPEQLAYQQAYQNSPWKSSSCSYGLGWVCRDRDALRFRQQIASLPLGKNVRSVKAWRCRLKTLKRHCSANFFQGVQSAAENVHQRTFFPKRGGWAFRTASLGENAFVLHIARSCLPWELTGSFRGWPRAPAAAPSIQPSADMTVRQIRKICRITFDCPPKPRSLT